MSVAALVTAFESRIPSARVIQLTNPKNKAATSKNSTQLTNASTDAHSKFEAIVGVALDTDVNRHLWVGIILMEAFLLRYQAGGSAEARARMKEAEEEAERLALVEGRDSIEITTNSDLAPTGDQSTTPSADSTHFPFQVNPPSGASTDPDVT